MAGFAAVAESADVPRVSVSVVTYNNAECLPVFLESLRQQSGVTWEARFLDNASTDETRAILATFGSGEVDAIGRNVGYSRGHNRNIALCRGEYVLLLNADLRFGPHMFARLVAFMDANERCAIAGPCVLEGSSRQPFPPRRFYPGEGMIGIESGLDRREIAWLNGCCLIARRKALAQLGGFDEDYFLYQAETDLCLRARRAGHKLAYCEDVVVEHLHRNSLRGISEYEYARRVFEGSAVFWVKHYSGRDAARMARFQYRASQLLLVSGGGLRRIPSLARGLDPARLRARRDICRECLDRTAGAQRASSYLPGRILWRQFRIAFEWMRQRRFPLDDY